MTSMLAAGYPDDVVVATVEHYVTEILAGPEYEYQPGLTVEEVETREAEDLVAELNYGLSEYESMHRKLAPSELRAVRDQLVIEQDAGREIDVANAIEKAAAKGAKFYDMDDHHDRTARAAEFFEAGLKEARGDDDPNGFAGPQAQDSYDLDNHQGRVEAMSDVLAGVPADEVFEPDPA